MTMTYVAEVRIPAPQARAGAAGLAHEKKAASRASSTDDRHASSPRSKAAPTTAGAKAKAMDIMPKASKLNMQAPHAKQAEIDSDLGEFWAGLPVDAKSLVKNVAFDVPISKTAHGKPTNAICLLTESEAAADKLRAILRASHRMKYHMKCYDFKVSVYVETENDHDEMGLEMSKIFAPMTLTELPALCVGFRQHSSSSAPKRAHQMDDEPPAQTWARVPAAPAAAAAASGSSSTQLRLQRMSPNNM